ncbi:MAG: CinA family protein [Nostocoides sp.]
MTGRGESRAQTAVCVLAEADLSIGCAESLTAGWLAGTIANVPGASTVLRGGVVAYATDVKKELLGVDGDLLRRNGAVDPQVARQMATGVCRVLRCDVGLATTGVAGPTEQDGHRVGEVHIAVAWPAKAVVEVRTLDLDGDRTAIRQGAVLAAINLLIATLADQADPRRG